MLGAKTSIWKPARILRVFNSEIRLWELLACVSPCDETKSIHTKGYYTKPWRNDWCSCNGAVSPAWSQSNWIERVSFLSSPPPPRAGRFNKEAAVLCHTEEPVPATWLTQRQAPTSQAGTLPWPLKLGMKPQRAKSGLTWIHSQSWIT